MSFQWIFDEPESLSINSLNIVGQTQSRDGTVRAVSRGSTVKKFTVQMPSGPRYSDYKDLIAQAEALDRHTTDTVTIKYTQFPWYYGFTQPVSDEEYEVICTVFPQWTIFARNQISWSGAFEFVEVL